MNIKEPNKYFMEIGIIFFVFIFIFLIFLFFKKKIIQYDVIYSDIIVPTNENNARNSEADIIELKNGKFLLAYTEFDKEYGDNSPARIVGRFSSDQGRTWGDSFVLQENTGKINVMSPSLLRLSSGEILLFYLEKNSPTDCKLYLKKSFDEAENWSASILITPEKGYYVMNNDRAIELTDGMILAPVSVSLDSLKEPFISTVYYSEDKGENWRRSNTEIKLPKKGAMEPALVELKTGKIMMFIRTQLGKIYVAFSEDKGKTWTKAVPLEGFKSPEAPCAVKRIPWSNDLILVWNDNFNENHPHYGIRSPLRVAISEDEGKTWRWLFDLENDSKYEHSYPSITFFKDFIIFTYYEQNHKDLFGKWALKMKIIKLEYLYCLFDKIICLKKFF